MKNKILSLMLSVLCAFNVTTAVSCKEKENTDPTPTPTPEVNHDTPSFDLNRYLVPVWDDNGVAYNELAMIMRTPDDEFVYDVKLAYPIDEIVSVRDFSLDTEYVKGIDYELKDGILKINELGRLFDIAIPYSEYYVDKFVDGVNWPEMDGDGAQIKTEAEGGAYGLTAYQIAITYKHSATWTGVKPENKSAKLPKINQKLSAGQNVSMVCLGDSISAGWTASGYEPVFLRPFCPKYFDLVTKYTDYKWGNVTANNYSVGGMTAMWGTYNPQIASVVSANPDLVFIGFGMNDGSANISVAEFKNNIKTIMDKVRESCPNTEFVLVSTMLPNEEVGFNPGNPVLKNQKKYLPALIELENEYQGVAVADITSIHEHLLTRKYFRDMSANNINHPNDYLHRVYAQVILQTMFGAIETVEIPEV